MQVPSELKPAAWGAVGGAIALAVIGFSWGGWVTGGTADKTAKEAADTAIVRVLAPICAENFQQQADAGAKFADLMKASTWERGNFRREGRLGDDAGRQHPQHRRGTRLRGASAEAEGLIAHGGRDCSAVSLSSLRRSCGRLDPL